MIDPWGDVMRRDRVHMDVRSGIAAWGAAAVCCLAAGCASHGTAPIGTTAPATDLCGGAVAMAVPAPPRERTLREIGEPILSGFDAAASREDWQIGDRVLIGVRATKPTGVTTRLVLVELTGELDPKNMEFSTSGGKHDRKYEFTSDVARTRITLFDETGTKIAQAMGRFPIKLLGYGPYDGAEPMIGHTEGLSDDDFLSKLPDDQFDRVMRGWGSLFTFSGSLGKKGLFKQMLEDVIVRPSLLRLLLHPSAGLSFGTDRWPTHDVPWTPGGAVSVSTIHVPLALTIAGEPALEGDLLAAEPVAPLSLCGGLIRANGHKPGDESVRVDLELLAAARGNGGKVFKPITKTSAAQED